MKTLIVSSTYNEVSILIETHGYTKKTDVLYNSNNIDILISGIGTPYTTYRLTEQLNITTYKLIINIGIAGSFSKKIKLGEIVIVKQDEFADLGINDNKCFNTLFEEKLISVNETPFNNGKLLLETNIKLLEELTNVKAITVNTTSGNIEKINALINKFNPEIETMEGAAVTFVAKLKKTPVIQIRAISNYVEPRNKKNWKIKLAIQNLNKLLLQLK